MEEGESDEKKDLFHKRANFKDVKGAKALNG
jgi:hypothetical protein